MSVLPDMGLPNTMSEAEYEALPAGVARRIEVVHGYVIVCESLTPQHQQVARRLRLLQRPPCCRADAARPTRCRWPDMTRPGACLSIHAKVSARSRSDRPYRTGAAIAPARPAAPQPDLRR